MSLRKELPKFDTPDLVAQWKHALAILTRVGELDIPCTMRLGERQLLFQVLRAMGAREVLDIGTYCGTSALAFALAVGEGGHVVSVDIQDANAADGHWVEAMRRKPRDLMEAAGVSERVEFVTMDAREYMVDTRRSFDLISIDGHHELESVGSEVRLALMLLRPNGLVFLHDVQDEDEILPPGFDKIDGPRLALKELIEERAPVRAVRFTTTADGEWATATFLVRE